MSLIFLLIYFVIIIAVIEIHVILFRLTGLKLEVSRFQVISLMTGTGFTTGESELILGHPIRRKLAGFLILFGAFSLAVIISAISNFLSDDLKTEKVLYIAGGFVSIVIILKIKFIQKKLSKLFNENMKRHIQLSDLPIREVFLTDKEDYVMNLHIYEESPLYDKTLNAVVPEYEEREFVVLFIKRGDIKIRRNIYNTRIHEGDQIFLFGSEKTIHEIFQDDINMMENKLESQPHMPINEH
ncbi:TrkA C-terminal domain-containing protein [Metabacillus fastidiosus]|uniref:TrkA C-terminal domain-containing protein n=1 Tax=Metabacillus fastidiosus TaxID=1458 RepID=UPI002DBAB1BA|nr:TrkA C-terminal domain-containing protein [Metabacillus fastidiosus]MEC2078028.1 TrkA C-terminal domain-containing protein [Metabacillus fastidiosus]